MSDPRYETCFVFDPKNYDERPFKRRKVGKASGLHISWPARRIIYEKLWARDRSQLDSVLEALDSETVAAVSDFVADAACSKDDPKVESAILFSGPNLVTQTSIISQVAASVLQDAQSAFVTITSVDATNLKNVLKRINAGVAIKSGFEADDDEVNGLDDAEANDEAMVVDHRGPRLLNYDLRILQRAVTDQKLNRVVIAFRDCEIIDGALLSDLIDLFSCWKDRIPFVIIFGIATSIDTLQLKLSKRAIRCIRCRRFDVADASTTTEKMFEAIYESGGRRLWLGAGVCSSMLARQRDYLQNSHKITDSVQYAYMTHFYANPLSIFLDDSEELAVVPRDHFEAVRNTTSFMQLIEDILAETRADSLPLARSLLDSDVALERYIRTHVREGQQALTGLVQAARLFSTLTQAVGLNDKQTTTDIVLQALSGSIVDSARYKNLILHLKRISSPTFTAVLQEVVDANVDVVAEDMTELHEKLMDLLKEQGNAKTPLRSETDMQNSTMRTTVVARKIQLSKAKTALTEADSAYTRLLHEFVDVIKDYFSQTLIHPHSLPFNEIFLFDLKSPHRSVFGPRPRSAIERALSSPHDYLDCACCDPGDIGPEDETPISTTHPTTAILYKMYLESGMLINAADLRSAFAAIVGEQIEDGQMVAALFQRSLAELSYLGMVKGTKKKADHMFKLAWKGI